MQNVISIIASAIKSREKKTGNFSSGTMNAMIVIKINKFPRKSAGKSSESPPL